MDKFFDFKIIILLFFFACPAFAQLDKANKYYDDKEYTKAIKLYENILRKGDNAEALEKIANSYRIVKNYPQAEAYYTKLVKQSGIAPINHFYYGLVLKSMAKIEEAKEEFTTYSKSVPADKKTTLLIKACDEYKSLNKKLPQFEVHELANVNSASAEFSPVLFKDELVFVSDRVPTISDERQNYLHIYHTSIKQGANTKDNRAEAFSWPVNTDFHDGPVTFNAEQNVMVISHVDLFSKKGADFINRSKLYFLTLTDKKWSKPIPFQYNSDAYSIVHPSISADGKKLFFASDMSGGEGGMDIYVSEKQGDSWGTPQNIGNKVNTAGEEVFPYIRKDGTLFFSSDALSGFGGLDVFSAISKEKGYTNVKNVGATLNSAYDDFGIVFNDDDLSGYFSSDRPQGKGSDDIYTFNVINQSITIAGKVVINKNNANPLKLSKITLLSDEGASLGSTSTDKNGFFKFDNLEPGKKYLVKLDDAKDENIKYNLVDDNNKLIRETGIKGVGGKFVFRSLPANPDEIFQAPVEGITVAGNLLVGKNSTKPLAYTTVNLVDDDGTVVQTVVTNAFGSFVFTDLPPEKNYMVRVEEKDVKLPKNSRIILTNKTGKEMQSKEIGDNGSFKFELLAADKNSLKLMEVQDVDLKMDFKGKFLGDNKSPIANSKVNLVNEKGEIIQTTTTDEFGAFRFENLPADQHVLVRLDEKDPKLKKLKKITLTSDKGEVIKESSADDNDGAFKFNILPAEKNKLSIVYVDDPWLKVLKLKSSSSSVKQNLTIVEKIYYNRGEYKVLPEGEKILDKVIDLMEKDSLISIEIDSHTDSRSSAEFNLKLSEQRASAAVDYMVKNGVSKQRISGKGFGETQLINKCADGVECSEEEHAKNRRTEFKVSYK